MPSLAHIIVEPEKRDGQNSLWNNIGNMAAPVVPEAGPPPPPMVQRPERHQESCHLALLHSLRHGWGQLAHNNTFPEVVRRSGKTNEAVGVASQACNAMEDYFTNAYIFS